MVKLTRCCWFWSVRSGSFAAGFYTLIMHTIILTGGAFNLNTVMDTIPMLILSLLMLACSGWCVITSVLLLIGLCVDSRRLLVPWMVAVFTTTLLDILVSLYLLIEADFSKFLAVLFSIDISICIINAYCLLCVYSQYQDYVIGRGHPGGRGNRQAPEVEYRSERSFLSTGVSSTKNDSNATNSSSISAVHSSVPTGNNEVSVISEDLSSRVHNVEISDEASHANENGNLLTVVASSTERIIESNETSFMSVENEIAENSESCVTEILDIENEERALKD